MAADNTHIVWLLALTLICMGVAIVGAYRSNRYAAVAAYATLVFGHFSGYCHVDSGKFWFWGAASLIVVGINILLPDQVSKSRVGLGYFSTGALVGAILGMLTNTMAGIIVGCAFGLFIASVAYSRLDAGKTLGFPSRKFFNYLWAKGLPLVVIFSILSIIGIQLIYGGI